MHYVNWLKMKMNIIAEKFNTMIRQKSRVRWLKEGSVNTNFFHTSSKLRQTENLISELEDDNGNIISD